MRLDHKDNNYHNKPDGLIYLDNTATSWPKPPGVARAMLNYIDEVGANPGRSGHRLSIKAARIVYSLRESVCSLFGFDDPMRVIFGLNITDGINLALHGLLKPGDHVITSGMEHNAVMRPLRNLEATGVEITTVPCSRLGMIHPEDVEKEIKQNTRLIVINHASNVCGTILPIHEIGSITRKHNLLFMVDTAQSAGVLPIHMLEDNIDLLGFTGHKSLYGPMGTGGIIIGHRISSEDIRPMRQGGTGSRSEHEFQPSFFPDRFESGTPNGVGLAGLLAAIEWLTDQGLEVIRAHEKMLTSKLIEGLINIPGIDLLGPKDAERLTATIGFNIRGMEPSTAGLRLDEEFSILCRVGLHCAPAAHMTIGTFPDGCIRFGIGAFSEEEDINKAIDAIARLASEVK